MSSLPTSARKILESLESVANRVEIQELPDQVYHFTAWFDNSVAIAQVTHHKDDYAYTQTRKGLSFCQFPKDADHLEVLQTLGSHGWISLPDYCF